MSKRIILKYILCVISFLCLIYTLTLLFPQPFFKNKLTHGNITVYSDEEIPPVELVSILETVKSRLVKSKIYKEDLKQNIFIANNPMRWRYFTNVYYKVGGLNYVMFNHNIFLRKVDIKDNRLYGNSGTKVPGDRTLAYFITHEITHSLEFLSMPWYKYPIISNWTLEGYCEYIAHDSQSYEQAFTYYLTVPESLGAKYYTKLRTMVTFLLEKENVDISQLWTKVREENAIRNRAIPVDNPKIDDSYKW